MRQALLTAQEIACLSSSTHTNSKCFFVWLALCRPCTSVLLRRAESLLATMFMNLAVATCGSDYWARLSEAGSYMGCGLLLSLSCGTLFSSISSFPAALFPTPPAFGTSQVHFSPPRCILAGYHAAATEPPHLDI